MKKILLVMGLFLNTLAMGSTAADSESFEVCTPEGPCALRVTDAETGRGVWLVTDTETPLMQIWDGEFWAVPFDDYSEILAMLPKSSRMTLAGKNPTTGIFMRATVPPRPAGSGGPLVTGTVNVTIGSIGGGGSNCTDCHTGSNKEIHKQVLKKPDGGK
jgi:hypothetical protein